MRRKLDHMNKLYRHRRRNDKIIKHISVGRGMSRKVKNRLVFGLTALLVVFAILITLNTAVLHQNWLPTWTDLYSSSGLNDSITSSADVSVHYIDVGQGDCELIRADGYNVLIDSGEKEYFSDVINYLKAQGIKKLDYVIVTHPHSDHAGSMSYILDEFDVGKMIMPELTEDMIPSTTTYIRLFNEINEQHIALEYAKSGKEVKLGDCLLKIIAPVNDYEDLNNYSVVVKFINGENSFLFTGDIEKQAEDDILENGLNVSADVIKIAHHGSSTSSQKSFLKAVGAEYAVIEVGSPNSNNHPNDKIIERLEALGTEIYRTDIDGSIIFESDGTQIVIKTEKEMQSAAA